MREACEGSGEVGDFEGGVTGVKQLINIPVLANLECNQHLGIISTSSEARVCLLETPPLSHGLVETCMIVRLLEPCS